MPWCILSPDRLARNYAHQWLLIEEFEKMNTPLIFLQNPFGDSPQGKLLTQMQGMIAEYERAQIAERTRRGRLEKARHGEFIPWAYTCYGYRYLPKRHGCAPQVMIEPVEAAVVRDIYRALVEEQLSCRQITKRLNAAKTPTPTGKNARLATRDGPQHSDQSRLCRSGTLQLSAASDPAVSQDGGTPTALSQDRAKLSRGERMGLERRAGHHQRRAV